MQIVLNPSISEQVEISEASLHFTAEDTEIQKSKLDSSKITGQVCAWIFFFFILSKKKRRLDFAINSAQ